MTKRATQRAVPPTNSELAPVPVIGGGPAGMSCALWLHNYGFQPLIMEREHELGGMARRSPYPNEWLLGWPGTVARQNAEQFARHIRLLAIDTWLGVRPQRLAAASDGLFVVKTSFCDERPPQSVSCRAAVIATGTRFRGAEWLDEV